MDGEAWAGSLASSLERDASRLLKVQGEEDDAAGAEAGGECSGGCAGGGGSLKRNGHVWPAGSGHSSLSRARKRWVESLLEAVTEAMHPNE